MSAQDDKSYLTSIAIGFSIAITVVAVSLRLLARKLHKIPIGADDYAIIVGAVDLQRLETTKDSLGTDVRRFSPSATPSFSFSVSDNSNNIYRCPLTDQLSANKYGHGRHYITIQPDDLTRYWTVSHLIVGLELRSTFLFGPRHSMLPFNSTELQLPPSRYQSSCSIGECSPQPNFEDGYTASVPLL